MSTSTRRDLLKGSVALAAGMGVVALADRCPSEAAAAEQPAAGRHLAKAAPAGEPFKISLAEWSLHKSLFEKKIDHLDFPKIAKNEFGIEAVEYVNQFFKDKAKDQTYLAEMRKR